MPQAEMECDIDTLGVRRSGTFARGEVFASTLWGTLVAEPIARATWQRFLDEISSRWRSAVLARNLDFPQKALAVARV